MPLPTFLLSGWRAVRQFLASRTRRQWWQAAACVPVLGLLLVGVLVLLTPSLSDIRKAKEDRPARILSADGQELALLTRSNRRWVPLRQVSPHVVTALIATEDHRFYEHRGMDWRRTASSVLHTLTGDRQGGSTLTQQLARNLYPEQVGREATLTRKLKEAVTAYKIEALYTKDEILETYLNTVPFLYNAFGIEMAARTYFDKGADKLSVLEAATLVGMLKGTSYYNPVRNPERSVARRNTVLAQMAKRNVLEPAEFERLKTRPLKLDFERQEEATGPAPHFVRALRSWLVEWADQQGHDLHSDGLVVHTTLDARMQQWATQAVAKQGSTLQGVAQRNWSSTSAWGPQVALTQTLVKESSAYRSAVEQGEDADAALQRLLADREFLRTLRDEKTRVQAGFLAMDPRNGHILAWVGSRDYAQDPFDHVQQARRQPGSTFKPFVYGAALLAGSRPTDTLMDSAVHIPLPGGQVWKPTDAQPPSDQPMTLADGLAYSKNTITAQVMQHVGPARVAQLAQSLGVRSSPLEAVPALALGSSPVALQEMVTAYASLARAGQYLPPVMVTRITDRHGAVIADFAPPAPQSVMPADAALTLVDMLRGPIDKGTARAIRTTYGIRADVAGKTGTTQGNADGWFILMHPQLVAGAWAGFNDGRITLRSDHWGQGARSALPMVGQFTQQALRSKRIDADARFAQAQRSDWWEEMFGGVRDAVQDWWKQWPRSTTPQDPLPDARPVPAPTAPQPPATAPMPPVPAPEPERLPAPAPEAGPDTPPSSTAPWSLPWPSAPTDRSTTPPMDPMPAPRDPRDASYPRDPRPPRESGAMPSAPPATAPQTLPPMPGSTSLPPIGGNAPRAPQEPPLEERTPTWQEQGLPAPSAAPPAGQDGAYQPYPLPPMPGQRPSRAEPAPYPMPPFGG